MYYNVKIYLKEEIPFVGSIGETNFSIYDKASTFVENCGINGFAIQNESFGTIAIPAHNIKYIHAITIEGDMPVETSRYMSS